MTSFSTCQRHSKVVRKECVGCFSSLLLFALDPLFHDFPVMDLSMRGSRLLSCGLRVERVVDQVRQKNSMHENKAHEGQCANK